MNLSFRQVCRRWFSMVRPAAGDPRRRGRRVELEPLEAREVLTGTWATLTNAAPAGIGTMMLLSDGTVMAQGGGVSNAWYRLTPNAAGSYTSGTWTSLASMSLQRLYFASNVLQDGRVFVLGGEYSGSGGSQNFTNTGEIYNPVTNSWSGIANFPQSQFGDDPSKLLPNGNILAGYLSGPQTYIYNATTNTWSATGSKLLSDRSDEETWLKLPDDSILSYDVFASGHAQRYVPSTATWADAGNVPVSLSSSAVGYELGPAFLLPDGRAFFLGANGNTAFYTPGTNSWAAGPVIPSGLGCDDAPGAILPNGKILFAADHFSPLFTGPTSVFEFDPTTNTYTDVTPSLSGFSTGGASYTDRMLVLPTGQVLFTTGGSRLAIYTPDLAPNAAWKPTVFSVDDNGDGTFTLAGRQLNGISQGASYGDDAEMDTNYPIVQLTADNGTVSYARTFNWSSTGVATGGALVSTQFTLPAGLAPGHYNLTVIANGIASDPAGFVVNQPHDDGFELPHLAAGTFQYNPSGSPWTFSSTSGVASNGSSITASNPPAPQGTQVGFVQFTGTVSQNVTLASGVYALTLRAAQRATNASSQIIQVQVDGGAVSNITPVGTSYAAYNSSRFVISTAGAHTLSFVGLDPDGLDNTALLDQVHIHLAVNGFGFEVPSVAASPDFIQYDPTGTPLTYVGQAGVVGNGSSFLAGNPNAPQGTQAGFLQNTGSFSATGNVVTAGFYVLSFEAAQRAANATTQTFQVLVDGSVVGTFTPTGTGYTAYGASFLLTTGMHTVSFVGTDPDGMDNTALIDQVLLFR